MADEELPDGVTKELIFSTVDAMLRTTSWDDITLKQVLATLEGKAGCGAGSSR